MVFTLILEFLKVTDEDDKGTIRVAPQDCFPAVRATLSARFEKGAPLGSGQPSAQQGAWLPSLASQSYGSLAQRVRLSRSSCMMSVESLQDSSSALVSSMACLAKRQGCLRASWIS